MKRRTFIRRAAAVSLGLGQSGRLFAGEEPSGYIGNLGVQLYTLRALLGKDAVGTLKQVAAAGYRQAEGYGFPGAEAMILAARDAGLAVHSSHFDADSVIRPKDAAMADFARILDKAHRASLKHLVIPYLAPWARRTLDDYKKLAANANRAADMAKKEGIQLSYHNHNFEFEPKTGGECGYEVLIDEFSPAMKFEIDVFWAKVGGDDPAALIRKLSGRVSQLHLKDLAPGLKLPKFSSGVPVEAFTEIGKGIIAMGPILVAAKEAGVEYCHVEQDESPDPLASIRQSIRTLQQP